MAPMRIRPGFRKTSVMAAGVLFLAAAGAATTTGLFSQTIVCPAELNPGVGTALTLELDYLAGTNAIISRTDPYCTLKRSMAAFPLNLTVLTNRESYTPRDPNACLYPDEADSLVCGTMNWDTEYGAHGVVVPNPAVYELDATGKWTCPGGRLGVVWLLPPCGSATSGSSTTWVSGFRKHFLAFWKPDKGDPVARDNQAFITNVHELGHVFNLHHCEYNNDGLDNKGIFKATGSCASHMGEINKNEMHVMPGTQNNPGMSFCDYNRTHWRTHKNQTCCGVNREVDAGAEFDLVEEKLKNLRAKVGLSARPEKPRYLPGEPIHLDVSIDYRGGPADATRYSYLDGSLNPGFGQLFFSVKPKFWPTGYRVLSPTSSYHVAQSNPIELAGPVEQKGVGIWFTLSDSKHPPRQRPFWVKADFAGFTDPELHLESDRVEIVVNTNDSSPGLFNQDAYELFTHPAARQFLFFLGGDHLPKGYQNLAEISARFSETIYAPYADVALGAYWARPFRGMGADGAIIAREPDLAKARQHLQKAKSWNDRHAGDPPAQLPPSWKAILDATLDAVQQALGGEHS